MSFRQMGINGNQSHIVARHPPNSISGGSDDTWHVIDADQHQSHFVARHQPNSVSGGSDDFTDNSFPIREVVLAVYHIQNAEQNLT